LSTNETPELNSIKANPGRAREPRQEATARHRRRRNAGSLNRMASFNLDRVDARNLDLENFVYRWVKDENGRLRMVTKEDDYDFVATDELGKDFDVDATDSESSERVRILAGTSSTGQPIYHYLVKKLREYHEADNELMVRAREDMMAGRVFHAELENEREASLTPDVTYVPPGVQIGHAAERRRGPVARSTLPK
jgi:hypothetical protein